MLSIDDQRPGPALPAQMNLAEHVLFGRSQPGDHIALEVLGADSVARWTYDALRHAVMTTAGGFAALSLPRQAKILMRLGNSPDFPIVFLGAIAAGLCPTPTSAALGTAEVTRLAKLLDPKLIVADDNTPCPDIACPIVSPKALSSEAALTDFVQAAPNDPAYTVFTSGTSGSALGVVHAHRAILARQMMFKGWYGLRSDDRMFHAGAFNWTFTLGTGLMDPWTIGATALVVQNGTPVEAFPNLVARHDATLLAGAPGVFRRFLRDKPPVMPRLRHALSAGEKLTETLRKSWRDQTGTELHEAFGQSECSTFISGSPLRRAPEGTLGYAQPGRAVAVLDGDTPVPRGTLGDLAVHASDPGLCLGYLGKPLTLNGDWCKTGDQGVMREDGSIEYHGRVDDMLTAGGFRVSPIEIEEAMQRHADIDEAAAVDHRISRDTTIIALHYTGKKLEDETLKNQASEHLARYKQPRLFIHAQSLPRNANGKLLRSALRAANDGSS